MRPLDGGSSPRPTSPAEATGQAITTLLDLVWTIEPDPLLPLELLPADWPGAAGRRLCLDAMAAFVEQAGEHFPARMRELLHRL